MQPNLARGIQRERSWLVELALEQLSLPRAVQKASPGLAHRMEQNRAFPGSQARAVQASLWGKRALR